MANTFAPFGFRQLRRFDGGAPTMGFDTLTIASSDTAPVFTGDPVATNTSYGNYVTAGSVVDAKIRGIFLGCEYYSPTVGRKVWSPYFPGSVQTSSGTNDVTAWVCTDPDILWIAQCSTTATVTSSNLNNNIGYVVTGSSLGNTLSGVSVVTLDSTAIGTSSSYPFRIVDFYSNYAPPGTNGTDNASAGNILVVAGNNWDRKNLTAP